MLNVIDGRHERSLVGVHHSLLDFLRAQAGVLPNDTDNGDVDGWKISVGVRRRENAGLVQGASDHGAVPNFLPDTNPLMIRKCGRV